MSEINLLFNFNTLLVWFFNYAIKRGGDNPWKKCPAKTHSGSDPKPSLTEVCGENHKALTVKAAIRAFQEEVKGRDTIVAKLSYRAIYPGLFF